MTGSVHIEGGDVLANLEDRTITGRLIPFGEEGRTNLGRFMVEAGTVTLPADPAVIVLNLDHDRTQVVGGAHRVWEQQDGIYASWKVANTPEGDAALHDATTPGGRRQKLSGEFGPAVIRAGKLLAGHARLWGSALVERGAFPSAMVLASDTPETSPAPADDTPATPATNPEGESTVTTTETAGATTTAPAEAAPVVLASAAPIPATFMGALSTPAARTTPRDSALVQVLAALNTLRLNRTDDGALQVLAALSDIKVDGNGALPTGANGTPSIVRPEWVGELYDGVPYIREFVTLGKLGTDISISGKAGYTIHRRVGNSGTTEMEITKDTGTWLGNKAEISSHSGFVKNAQSSRRNFAVGNDFAREFWDLPGGLEVALAYLRLLVEEYYIWADLNAAEDWKTAAGAPLAPATGKYSAEYPEIMGMIIQGILAVKKPKGPKKRRDVPTFAILNEAGFEALAYAAGGDQHLPAFLEFRVSTDGSGTADRVQLVQGDTGIEDTPSVIVGAQAAIEFDELPGGPLVIDALDIARGGVDKAVHGYFQTFNVRPEAVALIGTADA